MTSRVKPWLAYALAWVPAALLYSASVATQSDVTLLHGLTSGVVVMGAAALEGVAVWWLSGRIPLPERSGRLRFALLHTLFAALYTVLWLAVMGAWLALVAGSEIARLVLRQAAVWQLLSGIYIYLLVAGVSYLLRSQRTVRERSIAVARAETAATRAQLQAIRAQLQPHFLFNALHAVSAVVRHDPVAAERALEQLGDLLRHSLEHRSHELVPLAAEWQFTRDYLSLEQLRFGERLQVAARLEDHALDALLPPFLLQPLIENAVRHGIAPRVHGGTVQIDAQRRNGTLSITIRDDGVGTDPQRITSSGGLGLESVRRQLAGRYGERASLRIETAPDRGFAAIVQLPAEDALES